MKNLKHVTTIQSNTPGKTIAIVAGIHGNETGTLQALRLAQESISIDNGTIHYVVGNPLAVEKGVRFVENNLNRAFKANQNVTPPTYEQRRALELMELFDTCDALLDLHSVSNPKATPFIICEKEYFDIAKKFPFPIRSSGWNKIEPGSTDFYMSTHGKIGLCLECGFHEDPEVPNRALEGIKTFLSLMGNIKIPMPADNFEQKEISASDVHISKTNFILAREFTDFEFVPKDTLIGYDEHVEFRMPKDGILIFARSSTTPNQEVVIMSF